MSYKLPTRWELHQRLHRSCSRPHSRYRTHAAGPAVFPDATAFNRASNRNCCLCSARPALRMVCTYVCTADARASVVESLCMSWDGMGDVPGLHTSYEYDRGRRDIRLWIDRTSSYIGRRIGGDEKRTKRCREIIVA